jgi:hypothetical protein
MPGLPFNSWRKQFSLLECLCQIYQDADKLSDAMTAINPSSSHDEAYSLKIWFQQISRESMQLNDQQRCDIQRYVEKGWLHFDLGEFSKAAEEERSKIEGSEKVARRLPSSDSKIEVTPLPRTDETPSLLTNNAGRSNTSTCVKVMEIEQKKRAFTSTVAASAATAVTTAAPQSSAEKVKKSSTIRHLQKEQDKYWYFLFDALNRFYVRHGHFNIPKDYVIPHEGNAWNLSDWLETQQALFNSSEMDETQYDLFYQLVLEKGLWLSSSPIKQGSNVTNQQDSDESADDIQVPIKRAKYTKGMSKSNLDSDSDSDSQLSDIQRGKHCLSTSTGTTRNTDASGFKLLSSRKA